MSIADGRVIQSVKGSKRFQWIMQGTLFQDDFLVLPIGSCDMVLGVQWLCKLGNIHMNFGKLFMQFVYLGKSVTLQGACPTFKTVDAKALNKIFVDTTQIFMIKVCTAGVPKETVTPAEEGIPKVVQSLIQEYHKLFREPSDIEGNRIEKWNIQVVKLVKERKDH